jgi:hypothetical protein
MITEAGWSELHYTTSMKYGVGVFEHRSNFSNNDIKQREMADQLFSQEYHSGIANSYKTFVILSILLFVVCVSFPCLVLVWMRRTKRLI